LTGARKLRRSAELTSHATQSWTREQIDLLKKLWNEGRRRPRSPPGLAAYRAKSIGFTHGQVRGSVSSQSEVRRNVLRRNCSGAPAPQTR